jgi:BCCT family betaine/carnitine transporter
MESKKQIDAKIFWPALAVVTALIIPLALNPGAGGEAVDGLLKVCTQDFGWLFLLFGLGSVIFLLWLGFGRYGQVKLGSATDEPEFSTFSWIAMMFCAGIGIAIVNWSFVEPVYHIANPPLGFKPHSEEAAEWAGMYAQFHWALTPWAIYALPTFAIAYSVYVRKQPFLRLSTAAEGVLGDRAQGWLGKVIDIVVIFAIVGGVGTSLGLAVPLVMALCGELFGLEDSPVLKAGILTIWTCIFGLSAYKGLSKGLKVLSDVNVYLAFVLVLFVLVVGPTFWLLTMWSNSFGLMLDNFFRVSLWTDPIRREGFPESWTVFYWAWWIAYAPMVALFVARISKGRTIREVVLAELGGGSLGCILFLAIWGGYAIHLQSTGVLSINDSLQEGNIPATIIAVLGTLTWPRLFLAAFTVLCFIFLATTLASAAYTVASIATKDLRGDEEPAPWHRLFWSLVLAVVAAALLAVGGLKIIQLSSVLVAVPLMPVLVIVNVSLLRWLKRDHGAAVAPRVLTVDNPPSGQRTASTAPIS